MARGINPTSAPRDCRRYMSVVVFLHLFRNEFSLLSGLIFVLLVLVFCCEKAGATMVKPAAVIFR